MVFSVATPIIFAAAKHSYECNRQQNAIILEKNSVIKEFDKVNLLSSSKPQNIKIVRGGDCFDSSPYITLVKEARGTINGGE